MVKVKSEPFLSSEQRDEAPGHMGPVVGVLMAGGLSRRMGGGDKSLKILGDKPLIRHAIERSRPQVDHLILNAAGDPARFYRAGVPEDIPIVADVIEGFAGPLAGVLTGLEWASSNVPGCRWVASFATDAPFFPGDLVTRLAAAIGQGKGDMACARSAERNHPVFALWPVGLAGDLRRAMVTEDIRKVDVWTARYGLCVADFSCDPFDPFFNVNRPEDLEKAAEILDGLKETATL